MSNNETLKDIVAEMRLGSTSGLPYAYRIGRPNRIGEPIQIDSVTVADLADRIEVAWKRERAEAELYWSGIGHAEAVAEFKWGNKAVMRKALEAARAALSSYADGGDEDNAETNAALAEIDAALAAPPRNCDRFATAYEAIKAWDGGLDTAEDIVRMITWLLGKAEGGAK